MTPPDPNELVERLVDLGLFDAHQRITIAFLVTRITDRVERKGIGVRRGLGLFDQHAKDAPLYGRKRLPGRLAGGVRFVHSVVVPRL